MPNASQIKIEARIRNIDKIEETADKCFKIATAHPYVAKIVIRVDEPNLPCILQRILPGKQKLMQLHLQRKDGRLSS